MKILILGAAGQIGRILTSYLLEQTNHELILYAKGASRRIKGLDNNRIEFIDSSFEDLDDLEVAMNKADVVYINHMADTRAIEGIVEVLKNSNIKKVIVASILGIYDEVIGEFGEWNKKMVGIQRIKTHAYNASLIENCGIDYTILRLTWLYNNHLNKNYSLSSRNEPFVGAQVTREAVSQLIVDIIEDKSEKFKNTSIGVIEPFTNFAKPSFY